MFTILLHSSKTMRSASGDSFNDVQAPVLERYTAKLIEQIDTLSVKEIEKYMSVSSKKAQEVKIIMNAFSVSNPTLPAIDSFLGDIYSGLQVQTFSKADREYANKHLFILSGLYGVLRVLDAIQPYRLEMGYKLPGIKNMYDFWGDKIAKQLPIDQPIINLSAKEYTKAVFPHFKNIEGLKDSVVISPKFLTVNPKTNEPTFVTVHAKIARGAFARWLIQQRIEDLDKLSNFNELGYVFDKKLSTPDEPVFVAHKFEGLGLSVRLT